MLKAYYFASCEWCRCGKYSRIGYWKLLLLFTEEKRKQKKNPEISAGYIHRPPREQSQRYIKTASLTESPPHLLFSVNCIAILYVRFLPPGFSFQIKQQQHFFHGCNGSQQVVWILEVFLSLSPESGLTT